MSGHVNWYFSYLISPIGFIDNSIIWVSSMTGPHIVMLAKKKTDENLLLFVINTTFPLISCFRPAQ